MKVRIRIVDFPKNPTLEFVGPTISIGRDASCDIPLNGLAIVSGRHACIQLTPDGAFISDQGSKNGTYVNDCRVDGQQMLRRGDHFRLGQTGPELQIVELDLTAAWPAFAANAFEEFAEAPARPQPRPKAAEANRPQPMAWPELEEAPAIPCSAELLEPAPDTPQPDGIVTNWRALA